MWTNMIKAGGYILILNEVANQVKRIRQSHNKAMRRNRTKNMVLGAGIGTAVGGAAGILFAPKSGRDTRKLLADRTSETVKNFKNNMAATTDRLTASAAEKGARLREAGQKGVEAAKETLKKSDNGRKKESKK